MNQNFTIEDGIVSVISDDHELKTIIGKIIEKDDEFYFEANDSISNDENDSMSMILDVAYDQGLNFSFEVSI